MYVIRYQHWERQSMSVKYTPHIKIHLLTWITCMTSKESLTYPYVFCEEDIWGVLPKSEHLIQTSFLLAATKQLYKWLSPSVRPSVCLSVCLFVDLSVCLSVCPSVRPSVRLHVTPFALCSHHRITMTFSGVISNDLSDEISTKTTLECVQLPPCIIDYIPFNQFIMGVILNLLNYLAASFHHDDYDYYSGAYRQGHSSWTRDPHCVKLGNFASVIAQSVMFLLLDLLLAYWIEHVAIKFLDFYFEFLTMILFWVILGFEAYCSCKVWCQALTSC